MKNLESLLERELRPVTAPKELLERFEAPRAAKPRTVAMRWSWAVAAVAVVTIAWAWGSRPRAEIRSNDVAEIRGWVFQNTGLELPLRASAVSAQLSGARLVDGGKSAEIKYQVAGFDATLLIARAGTVEAAGHGSIGGGRKTTSWTSKGQVYMLECGSPEALKAACRLCHGS